MATDKIVQKILEDAKDQAEQIKKDSKSETKILEEQLKADFEQKKEELNKEQQRRLKETQDRIRLGTSLEERKLDLGMRRDVLEEAFKMAKSRMKHLDGKDFDRIVRGIVLSAVQTDTRYLKPAKKSTNRCNKLLAGLNRLLKEQGSPELELDPHPAGFENGFMLIGEYSDVNANFDVLIDNIRESLEWDVMEILFGKLTD